MINTKKRDDMRSSFSKFEFALRATPLPDDFAPSDKDVVCGRGNAYCHLPGNALFSATIRSNVQHYSNTPDRTKRSTVVAAVLNQVLAQGCRFVKRDRKTNQWFEMSREQAHEKVGHALRDMIRFKDDDSVESNRSSASSKSSRKRSISSKAKKETRQSPTDLSLKISQVETEVLIEDSKKVSLETRMNDVYQQDELAPIPLHRNLAARLDPSVWDIAPLSLNESNDDCGSESDEGLDSRDYYKALQILTLDD